MTRRFVAAALAFTSVMTWAGVDARQARRAGDGVYTAAQAARGKATYEARCVACHGPELAGSVGPPLAGSGFLAVWGTRPLSDLVDKIHDTMPPDAAGTLTRPQAADLAAFVLESNMFPAGGAELASDDAALRQIALAPGAATQAAAAAAPAASFPAVGNLNQVMRGILFPSSNVLFDVQVQDPSAPRPAAAGGDTTTARYGNVYAPWLVVDGAAIALAESGPLLMTPGRRCENGKPVPVDRADWKKYVDGLVEAGRAAYRASQRRNQAAVSMATDQISDACANCHRVYRDTATAAQRCTPPNP